MGGRSRPTSARPCVSTAGLVATTIVNSVHLAETPVEPEEPPGETHVDLTGDDQDLNRPRS